MTKHHVLCTLLFAAVIAVTVVPTRAQWEQLPMMPPKVEGNSLEKDHAFRLKGLDGKIYDSAEMRGEVVVVSFGATWCAPCAWELVAIEELKQEYRGRPVRFLWVSIEDEARTSKALLKYFAKSQKLTIPVLRDEGGQVFTQFSTSTRIPLVVFFDKQGRFAAPVHRGMSQDVTQYKQLIRARVDALIKAEAKAGDAAAK